MPVVPTYQPGQVQQRVAQTPQATPDSFGAIPAAEAGQVGRSFEAAGNEGMSEATRLQEMTNRDVVRDSISQAENDAFNYVSDNVLSKKGKDAIGLLPDAQTQMQNIGKQYSDGLTNPAQQRLFNGLYPQVYNRASNMARRHILNESMAYHQQTLTASMATATNSAVADYNNPDNISNAEMTIRADNNALYPGDTDAQNNATALGISKLHTDIANSMADTDPARASEYIRTNKGKILPASYDTMDKQFTNQIVSQGAMKAASTLSQLDPNTAMAQANQIQDPTQRALTIDTLKTHFAAQDAAKALDSANTDSNYLSTVVNNPETAAMSLPTTIPPQQRQQLIQSANDRIAAKQGGQAIQTNMDVYGSLINQAANDPDGFLRRPLSGYASQLNDGDWHQVLDIRSKLANNKKEQIEGEVNRTAAINDTFKSLTSGFPELSTKYQVGNDWKDLPPGPALQQRMQDINAFRNDFQSRLQQQYPDPKRQTPENAEGILNKMLSRVVVQKAWGWGPIGASARTQLQGQVDENPSLKWWTGSTPLVPGNYNGNPAYFEYNNDRTSAKVYDNNGNSIGTWPNQ